MLLFKKKIPVISHSWNGNFLKLLKMIFCLKSNKLINCYVTLPLDITKHPKSKKASTPDIYSLTRIRAMVGIILSGIVICYVAKLLLSFGGIWVILGSMVLILMIISLSISLKLAFLYYC